MNKEFKNKYVFNIFMSMFILIYFLFVLGIFSHLTIRFQNES